LPDLETADGVKKAFLGAKSVTWVGAGAARAQVDKMLAALGISDAVTAKLALVQSVDEAIDRVAGGKSDLAVMLASEILAAGGLEVRGHLPRAIQGLRVVRRRRGRGHTRSSGRGSPGRGAACAGDLEHLRGEGHGAAALAA